MCMLHSSPPPPPLLHRQHLLKHLQPHKATSRCSHTPLRLPSLPCPSSQLPTPLRRDTPKPAALAVFNAVTLPQQCVRAVIPYLSCAVHPLDSHVYALAHRQGQAKALACLASLALSWTIPTSSSACSVVLSRSLEPDWVGAAPTRLCAARTTAMYASHCF